MSNMLWQSRTEGAGDTGALFSSTRCSLYDEFNANQYMIVFNLVWAKHMKHGDILHR